MSRTLRMACVRTTLHVLVDGTRVGIVHRDVEHRLTSTGAATSITRFTGIADCHCMAEKSVHLQAASDEAAGQWVAEHMAMVHGIGAQRGVA